MCEYYLAHPTEHNAPRTGIDGVNMCGRCSDRLKAYVPNNTCVVFFVIIDIKCGVL